MTPKPGEMETDAACYKGESLRLVAMKFPERFYISLEHYTRVTEDLCRKLSDERREAHDLKENNYVFKWAIVAAFGIGVLIGQARW